MNRYGLIGYPLGHSFSARYFNQKFKDEGIEDTVFEAFPLKSLDEFNQLLENKPDLKGLTVTIPYKEQIFKYLDVITDEAKAVGAVNMIKIESNSGKRHLVGYNTDIYGFKESLPSEIFERKEKALVFGSGGASKAVVYILKELQIPYFIVSRQITESPDCISYEELENNNLIESHTILINTTPLGMFPEVSGAPDINYNQISKSHILIDLVYNPEVTEFMKRGMAKGAIVCNGLAMLHAQAEKAWQLWNM